MSFGRAALGSLGSTILGNLVMLLTGVLTARLLGPEGKGTYAFAVLIPYLAVNVCTLGLNSSVVYFVARGGRDAGSALGTALALVLGLSAACLVGLLAVLRSGLWGPAVAACLSWTLWSIPFAAGYSMARHGVLGLQRYGEFNLLNMVDKGLVLLGLLVAWAAGGVSPVSFSAAYAVSAAVGFALALVVAVRAIDGPLRLDHGFAAPALRYGMHGHLGWLAELLNYRLDMLLLQALGGTLALGFYSVSVSLAEALWLIPSCISVVLMPRLAGAAGTREAMTATVCRLLLPATLLAAALLAAVSSPLLAALYGTKFLPALRPLLLLLPGVASYSIVKVLAADFAARGRPVWSSAVAGLSLVITVVLDIALIPSYGAAGAAVASSAAYATSAVLAVGLHVRQTANRPTDLLLPRPADLRLAYTSLSRALSGAPPGPAPAAGEAP